MKNLGETLFCDLGSLCVPQSHISDAREKFKWNRVPYETAHHKGTMLTAFQDARPEDVELHPQLEGYHRIFVCLKTSANNVVRIRLSGEAEWMEVSAANQGGYSAHALEESFWRVADMTGQRLVIGKHRYGVPADAMLAWLRFEPMCDEEVAAWRADQARADTKRIYATDDLHNRVCMNCPDNAAQWRSVVKNYEDSDVEWLSMEDVFIFDGECTTGNPDNFAFCRPCDELVQRRMKQHYTMETIADMIAFGHEQGLKMCTSMRMGAWGLEFPFDQMYFMNQFKDANPQYRCVDRDGSPIDALSYVFPEVRQYVIDRFIAMAALGGDAVEMMFNRGTPYVLFETPVVERFQKEYGDIDPRTLPLDDVRVNRIHCEIMTEFVRELRAALDAARPQRRIDLHARILFSLYDTKYVGVDVERWAREGLISTVISYPARVRELLDGDVWQEGAQGVLNIGKYTDYVRQSQRLPILHRVDFNLLEPMADSRGVPQGPKNQKERVEELMRLEKAYGVRVYIDIMPRFMSTLEYKARALELYENGCEGISLWDTYCRVPQRATWSMLRRLGHKDELKAFGSGEGEYYCIHRLLKVGDKDVSRYIPAWGG